jgi:hypothetical protein
MPLPTRGSVEWFPHQKKVVLRDARAFDSIAAAYRLAIKLRAELETLDTEVNSSLLSTVCINYGRPFSQPPTYPYRGLKGHPQFDVEIHEHLLELRNKLIAHSDEEYADATMHSLTIALTFEKDGNVTNAEFPQSLDVHVVALNSIHSPELVDRICNHLQAALLGVSDELNLHLREYLEASHEFGDNFHEARRLRRLETGSEPKSAGLNLSNPTHFRYDAFRDPLKVPPLQMGKDGYSYRTFWLVHALTGDFVVRFGDEEITLQVSSGSGEPEESEV